jgi:hypothetical protein
MIDDDQTSDAEQIAALLDGRLTGERRAALMARLAESGELTEILGEAAGLLRELEGGRQTPSVLAQSWWGSHQRTFLIAAGIVFVAIVPAVLMMTRGLGPARTLDDVPLPRTTSSLPVGFGSVAWPEPRTRGGVSALTASARAARAGVLFTDLELQVATADSAAAHTAERIIALVPDTPMSGLVIGVLRDAGTDTRSPSGERVVRVARARAAMGRLVGDERMMVAALIESARIAALERDSSFFRANANALDRARRSSALTTDERSQLERAVDAVPGDWGLALQRLTSLLVLMGS